MRKILILISILTINLFADITEEKNIILKYTVPMVNIFQDYDQHLQVSIKNIEIRNKTLIIKTDNNEDKYFFEAIGANFAKSHQISNKVNIYTLLNTVYYIESLDKFENYSAIIQVGSEFGKNESITNYGIIINYKLSVKTDIGVGLNGHFNTGQLNLAFCHQYKYSNLVNVKTGFEVHFNLQSHDLSKQFKFPNESKNYVLSNSSYSSFFIDPGITFRSGKFQIRQGIKTRFLIMGGDIKGIAYHLHPFVELNYLIK